MPEAPTPTKKRPGRKPAWNEPTAMLSARVPVRVLDAARARALATGRRFCRYIADALTAYGTSR